MVNQNASFSFIGNVLSRWMVNAFFVVLFFAYAVAVAAQQTFTIENIQYKYNKGSGTCDVWDGTEAKGAIVIPSAVEYEGVTYTVLNIGQCAFENNEKLTSVIISEGIEKVDYMTFEGCTNLASITLPESLRSIVVPFRRTGLTSLTIPSNVYYLDMPICSGPKFKEYIVSANNEFMCSQDGVLYGKDMTSLRSVPSAKTSFSFPKGVTSIGGHAFYDCSDLTSIDIPAGVISIGEYAFSGCEKILSLDIPSGVTYIGDGAFSGLNLTSIELPKGIEIIKRNTFQNCHFLASIQIPTIVTEIERAAFSGCSSLTDIEIPRAVTKIEDYTFCDCSSLSNIMFHGKIKSIGESAFYGCSSLLDFEIPYEVTKINDYTFFGCSGLTDVIFHGAIESIGEAAFGGCKELSSINLPKKVVSIKAEAFSDCEGLKEIYVCNEVPVVCPYNTFKDVDVANCILYVPQGAKGVYEAAEVWKEFKNIQEFDAVGIDKVVSESADVVIRYSLDGRVQESQKGIQILRMSDGTTRKVLIK